MKNYRVIIICIAVYMGAAVTAECADMSYKYWDNGKVRESTAFYDEQGDISAKKYYREDGSLEKEIRYDPSGDKIAEADFDSNGKLREGVDGWAAIKWKYESGQIIAEGYYGEGGHLKEYKEYNSAGDLVGKKYFGDDLDPSEEFNPEPTFAGENTEYYDSLGRKEGSTSIEYDTEYFPLFWE